MDQLAANYAGQPVRVLEYFYYGAPGAARRGRFWAAWGGGTAYWPMTITDCGQEYSDGSNITYAKYQSMVNAALARDPLGQLTVSRERVGDSLVFDVDVLNQSGETLSTSNGATVWALVYEEPPGAPDAHTGRVVVAAQPAAISPALADGQAANFDLVVDLGGTGVNWTAIKSVVLVDFRPAGGSVYDMLQAAFQD